MKKFKPNFWIRFQKTMCKIYVFFSILISIGLGIFAAIAYYQLVVMGHDLPGGHFLKSLPFAVLAGILALILAIIILFLPIASLMVYVRMAEDICAIRFDLEQGNVKAYNETAPQNTYYQPPVNEATTDNANEAEPPSENENA